MFWYWDAALNTNPDAPRWLAQLPIAACVAEGLHWRDGWEYALSASCIMPTHVHLVAKPLCDGLCDQESSERRASCRTEGLAIYLLCRPNVGRSGTSPALAPKDHCPDKQDERSGTSSPYEHPVLPRLRAAQRGRSGTSPYKHPVLPGLRAPQRGQSATSPYEHPVLPRLRAAQAGRSAIFCQSNNPRRRFKRQVVKIAQRNMRVKCPSGVADFGGVLPMSVAGVEPVRI